MKSPRVSVILPFFRTFGRLGYAIGSISGQKFGDWELLLVSNNAAPGELQVADGFVRSDPRIKLLHEPVQGIAHALNRGLVNARAELIARMDADDISFPSRFLKQVAFMDTNPETGVVATQAVFSPASRNTEGYRSFVEWQNSIITNSDHYLSRFIESPFAHPTVMFRKELVKKHGLYNTGSIPEDYELWLRWFEKGVKFYKLPEPLLEWYDHRERLSRVHGNYSDEAFRELKYRHLSLWINKTIPKQKKIVICGSSSNIRTRAQELVSLGIEIYGFTDVKNKPAGNFNFIPIESLANPEEWFVVNLITKRGVGQTIKDHFNALDFVEGKDFMLAG